jgi:hypothetical protein
MTKFKPLEGEERDEFLKKLKTCLENGNIECMSSDKSEDLLHQWEGTEIHLIREIPFDDRMFGLSVSDEGGFTGVEFTVEGWISMKNKVDEYLKSKGWL